MSKTEIIEKYLNRLGEDLGLDILISDYYGLLCPKDDFRNDKIIGGWHNNPYCLKIKSDSALWKRCAYLKRYRNQKHIKSPEPDWHICYCGVAEYVIPVIFGGVLIAEISVTGFKGELRKGIERVLSKRLDTDVAALHNQLKEITDGLGDKLNSYLLPVKEMILNIAEENGDRSLFLRQKVGDPSAEYVKTALDYINDNFASLITANDVARHCNLSLSYLKHLFGKFHLRGVSAEIQHLKIEMACDLLKNTTQSVRAIALKCGFKNVDYFSVAFKKATGTPPLKYRKEN